ncbi:major facilitator superfamily domain-containing protein [Haematococcus lacustris]
MLAEAPDAAGVPVQHSCASSVEQRSQHCAEKESTQVLLPSGVMNSSAQCGTKRNVTPLDMQEGLLEGAPAAQESFTHPIPVWRRRYMVCIFTLMATLLFADQNLLAPNLTQVAADLGISEEDKDQLLGGWIMAAFFAVGAPSAMLVGWLSDKTNRRNLLFVVVMLGSMPCLCTFWVTNYEQLLALRTLTGISVGGCFPLIFSLLGDLFPITQRAAVSAGVQIATGAGIAAGQALAGMLGESNWRIPFMVVAVPAVVVACIMLLTTQEPPRGAFEEALQGVYAEGEAYKDTITWAKVRVLLRLPTNWLIILQGLPGSLPWGFMLVFMNDYLSQNKGFSVKVATLIVLMFGLGGGLGVICGGALGQWLYNRRKEYVALLMGTSVFLGIGPLTYLVNAPLPSYPLGATAFLALLGGCFASVAGPNLKAVLLNVYEPETRGVAFALQTMTDDLGKGLGPFLVAWFIKSLGRQGAFNLSIGGWVPCGLLLTSLVFTLRKDEAAMQRRLQDKVDAMQCHTTGAPDGVPFRAPLLQPAGSAAPGALVNGSSSSSNELHVIVAPVAKEISTQNKHIRPVSPGSSAASAITDSGTAAEASSGDSVPETRCSGKDGGVGRPVPDHSLAGPPHPLRASSCVLKPLATTGTALPSSLSAVQCGPGSQLIPGMRAGPGHLSLVVATGAEQWPQGHSSQQRQHLEHVSQTQHQLGPTQELQPENWQRQEGGAGGGQWPAMHRDLQDQDSWPQGSAQLSASPGRTPDHNASQPCSLGHSASPPGGQTSPQQQHSQEQQGHHILPQHTTWARHGRGDEAAEDEDQGHSDMSPHRPRPAHYAHGQSASSYTPGGSHWSHVDSQELVASALLSDGSGQQQGSHAVSAGQLGLMGQAAKEWHPLAGR